MGRPSKLTDAQWEAIGKRLLADESAASLAREFDVSKTAISLRFSKRIETVKNVANQLVAADRGMASLNVSEQFAARTLANELTATAMHLAGAARFGAANAHRLNGLASARIESIPDGEMDDKARTAMAEAIAMTKTANEASYIGLNLLKANKEQIEEQRQREKEAQASKQEFKASNSAEAAVVYQQMIGSGS